MCLHFKSITQKVKKEKLTSWQESMSKMRILHLFFSLCWKISLFFSKNFTSTSALKLKDCHENCDRYKQDVYDLQNEISSANQFSFKINQTLENYRLKESQYETTIKSLNSENRFLKNFVLDMEKKFEKLENRVENLEEEVVDLKLANGKLEMLIMKGDLKVEKRVNEQEMEIMKINQKILTDNESQVAEVAT